MASFSGRRAGGRRFVVLGVLALLSFSIFLQGEVRSASASAQSLESGTVWTNEPLLNVFVQVENRIIGVVPGNFTEPTGADYSMMRNIFSLIKSGISSGDPSSIVSATSLAQQIGYELLPINDSGSGNKYFVLREDPSVNRGWGSYFFVAGGGARPSPTVIIEAPDPVTDFNSQVEAYDIFTNSYPHISSFFVSGIFRTLLPHGQSDMDHRSLSIFQTATEVFAGFGTVVIQIHTYDVNVHPGYPDVVLTTGDGGTNGALESIASNLVASGFSVGIFDGFRYEKLGATENVQGRYVRARGGGFVHAEISSNIAFNATLRPTIEGAIGQSVIGGFRFPGYQIDPRIPAVSLAVIAVFAVGRSLPRRPRAQ
jgi:hypothetical protein